MTRSSSFQGLVLIFSAVVLVTLNLSNALSPRSSQYMNSQYMKRTSVRLQSAHDEEVPLPTATNTFSETTRRMVLAQSAFAAAATGLWGVQPASGAVGTLPEYADTNAILQGITVNVADQSQQDAMIQFLQDSFDFKVLRQLKAGANTDTWMGYGPEQLSIPSDFTLPVSSFAEYGGHASIHIRYDAQATDVYYRKGEDAPGNNIAFLQVGVPAYRISQMVKNGGNVLDAYGIVNVVTPSGLPMRGIVGISPDPIMFVALNCEDVEKSRAFYEQLGFVEQEYPYARPSKGTGQFEPPQPPKSVYMAPSPNSMGVLLQPLQGKKKKITPNPVLRSLNVVYTPSEGAEETADETMVVDPSGVSIAFQSVKQFEAEQLASKIK